MCGQFVRGGVGLVVQATGDQGLIAIAFKVADQHFHADTGNGGAAVGAPGPAGCHAQPARAAVVALTFAVPEELHFDPTVFVAVNLFPWRAGDDGGLAAAHSGFEVYKGRAVRGVPWGGDEMIAIALPEIGFVIAGVVGDVFVQHLRLLALVDHFQQQPQVVPLAPWVFNERQVVATVQRGFVAVAFCQLVVAAMALKGAGRQLFTARALNEATGVIVVLQIRSRGVLGAGFRQQARPFEVVIAPGDARGAGFHAQVEVIDHWRFGRHPGALAIGHGLQFAEHRLVVTEHQHVPARAVLEVKVNAFLLAQTLDEVQVGLVVLHAVFAWRVCLTQLKAIDIGQNASGFEHLGDDPGHAQVLKNLLVVAVPQVGESGDEGDAVMVQAFAAGPLTCPIDKAVDDAFAAGAEGQDGGLVHQGFELQVRAGADQFDVEGKRLVEPFTADEAEHLEVVRDSLQREGYRGLVGILHAMNSIL